MLLSFLSQDLSRKRMRNASSIIMYQRERQESIQCFPIYAKVALSSRCSSRTSVRYSLKGFHLVFTFSFPSSSLTRSLSLCKNGFQVISTANTKATNNIFLAGVLLDVHQICIKFFLSPPRVICLSGRNESTSYQG